MIKTELREHSEADVTFRRSVMRALDVAHLGNLARRAKAGADLVQGAVMARTSLGWRPLVPEAAFTDCCRRAIRALRDADPDYVYGNYLEFGVSRGTSLACMYQALQEAGLSDVRLVGFDSFRGLPPEATAEHWKRGQFASTIGATRRNLKGKGVDLRRVQLVEGWFSETLTDTNRTQLGLGKASIIMVDCDIYSASRDALRFVAPLILDHAVIFLDDWGWRADLGEIGQQEAFADMLAAFPHLSAQPLPSYHPKARVFSLARHRALPAESPAVQ